MQAVRDDLYFPAAPIGAHLLVLGLYAGIGCRLVLITNMLPNRENRHRASWSSTWSSASRGQRTAS